MNLRFVLLPLLVCCSVTASGCADPTQRALEAQRSLNAQEPIKLPDDTRPNVMALADLNNDGSPDLVVSCPGKAAICVLLGNGKGKFTAAPGSPFATSTSPHLIAVGDFNSDKKVDVAVTSHDSNGVFIMLGDGKGGLQLTLASPFMAYASGTPHNHGLAVGDVNGDGHPDITMGHQDNGSIAVLLGDGKERFTPAPRSPFILGRGFYPHTLGDVNGDGKLDIAAPDIMGAAIVVALGDGKGAFTLNKTLRVKQRPFFIVLDDFNGDQKLDLAATHDDIHDVDVLLGDGRGTLTPANGSPVNSGRQGWKLASADINGDGQKDLVVAGQGGFTVLLGDGTGGFTAEPETTYPTAGAAWGMAVGDINKDRKPDVIVSDAEAGTVTVFLGK